MVLVDRNLKLLAQTRLRLKIRLRLKRTDHLIRSSKSSGWLRLARSLKQPSVLRLRSWPVEEEWPRLS
jgi:hypothetical protein